jgi:hypothetical protein
MLAMTYLLSEYQKYVSQHMFCCASAFDTGYVKTQNPFDFGGAFTIPVTKKIEYNAFLRGRIQLA